MGDTMAIPFFSLIAQSSGSGGLLGMYLLPLVGSVMLAYAIYNLIGDLSNKESKKILGRLKGEDGELTASANEIAARKSILRRTEQVAGGFGGLISRFGFVPGLQRMLDQANVPWMATTVLVNLIGLSSLAFIVCYVMQTELWVGISAAVAMLLLPLLGIFIKRKMRLNKLLYQLPDVFELMGQALRAGHSLANAILLISQQLPDPVGTEFARVFHEQNMGIKIEDALKDMAKRVGLMDVKFFVTAVLIQRQTGGDLAEVLDNIGSVIRDRIKLFGIVKALTAEGRLSGWVLLALPIVVFVMELMVNPDYANVLLDTEMGQYMLIGAGIAQLLGLAMIQKIVNIKV